MSAEDLTTLAGVSVQQDLALVSLLGLDHVERNGHHFIDGMSFAPEARAGGLRRARIPISTSDTARAGAAAHRGGARSRSARSTARASRSAAGLDFAAMRPMPPAPHEPIGRAGAAETA